MIKHENTPGKPQVKTGISTGMFPKGNVYYCKSYAPLHDPITLVSDFQDLNHREYILQKNQPYAIAMVISAIVL
ncbi:MAG: hypothetical protein V4506_10035 [Bacteroidota bacterium]